MPTSKYQFVVVAGDTASPDLDGELITRSSEGDFAYEPDELDTLSGTFWIFGLKLGTVKESVQVSPTGGPLSHFDTSYTSVLPGSLPDTNTVAIKTAAMLSTGMSSSGGGRVPILAGTIQHSLFGGAVTT